MDKAASAAPGGAARAVALADPTRSALGLPSTQPTPRSEVAAGALRLLDPAAEVADLAEGLTESLDELYRRGMGAVRWSIQLATPLRWLHR